MWILRAYDSADELQAEIDVGHADDDAVAHALGRVPSKFLSTELDPDVAIALVEAYAPGTDLAPDCAFFLDYEE